MLSGAYHYALNKKQTDVLTFGAQYGQIQRNSTDPEKAKFEDDLNQSGTSSPDRALLEQFRDSYPDLNLSVQYKGTRKKSTFEMGLSLHHIISPDFEALVLQNKVPKRMNFYMFHQYAFTKKFEIRYGQWASLSGLFSKGMAFDSNIILEVLGIFHLDKKTKGRKKSEQKQKDIDLIFGLAYRINDGAIFKAGINYELWSLMFSYDMTLSEASNYNNHNGAYELGIKRIINVYKKPEVDSVILCPKF